MMDDADLWARERAGEPVSHCRAKIAADRAAMKAAEQSSAERARRPRLGIRWAA